MAYSFKLPDIGEGVHEGEIVQWLVQPGDFVKEDQAIVEIMTDKVTAEIPSPVSGVISELKGKAGDVIKVGSVIAIFDQEGGQQASAGKSATETKTAEQGQEKPTAKSGGNVAVKERPSGNPSNANTKDSSERSAASSASAVSGSAKVLAAPATRKLARELDVDLSQVTGSGPRGRVTQTDVKLSQSGGSKPAPATSINGQAPKPLATAIGEFRSFGERRTPFSGLRRKIAERLVKSKQTAPHFAYVEEGDMSKLVAMRNELMPLAEAQGVNLSFLPFMIKAVIAGLRKYPALNSQIDEATQELVFKNDYHMGIAVATDQGLVVPVIKFADQKNLLTLAREIKSLAEKARSNKLALDDMRGGTFTLTSIGSIGGLFSVPIINYPEVAILGVNKIEKRPVVRTIDGVEQIVIRDMMHLSISCDHRAVDGAEAALFVKEVIQTLENPSRLLLSEGV
jgi:pyruvate dehydrogenase E2 component (dihydrolipoamide acetyltransferase)